MRAKRATVSVLNGRRLGTVVQVSRSGNSQQTFSSPQQEGVDHDGVDQRVSLVQKNKNRNGNFVKSAGCGKCLLDLQNLQKPDQVRLQCGS